MNPPNPPSAALQRRQRVFGAMRALMAERGFHVSMDAVAQRAGCSKQTLYAQFGSKQALIKDLMQEHLQITTAHLDAFDGRIREPLLAFANDHLTRMAEPEVIASRALFSAESPKFPEEARNIWRGSAELLLDSLAQWLSQAMQAGHLRSDNPHAAAELLMSMMLGMDLERKSFSMPGRPPEVQAAWAAYSVDTFLRAFAPKRQEPPH